MSDPIWLDTNVVQFALNGDAAVNEQLATFRNSGRQLLVPPAVANELLNGNVLKMHQGKNKNKPVWEQTPSPKMKDAMKQGMAKLGIQVDWSSSQVSMPARVNYSEIGVDNVSDSDRVVLGQIKASAEARGIAKPQMITGEKATKAMQSAASKWGIESVPHAKPKAGSIPVPPRIDLADYPPERKGPISRFFEDRPVLKKLGLIGLSMGAENVSAEMLAKVQEHFESVLQNAKKEFESKYPDPAQLKAKANLFRYKLTYEAALSKLKAPTGAKVAAYVMLAFAPDRDIQKYKKYFDDQISKVQSAADGSVSGYSKVASEYIDAMLSLYTQLTSVQTGLPEIARDIERRGSVIRSAGDTLDATFWRHYAITAAFPVLYYKWMDVHIAAGVFQGLGVSVLGFSSDIFARYHTYELIHKQLENELQKVSDELAKYHP